MSIKWWLIWRVWQEVLCKSTADAYMELAPSLEKCEGSPIQERWGKLSPLPQLLRTSILDFTLIVCAIGDFARGTPRDHDLTGHTWTRRRFSRTR